MCFLTDTNELSPYESGGQTVKFPLPCTKMAITTLAEQVLYGAYRIVPNRGAVRQSNGLEIHNLESQLILPVFKSKLYHY